MAERKYGTVMYRQNLSHILEIFRVVPGDGERFPPHVAGQYISLSKENCKLTRKIVDEKGNVWYVPDIDESGDRRRGTVTHSYSIASAPYETEENHYLEFYVLLETVEQGEPGRLSESLFHLDPETDNRLYYIDNITGDFTLEKRAAGYPNVVLAGSGTGLAPFASMIKQLHHDSMQGRIHPERYTLFQTNRTYEELGYHKIFLEIEAAQRFDFVYVPTVSRPTQRDCDDPHVGRGRGNNVLRSILEMSSKEEEDYRAVRGSGGDIDRKMQDKSVEAALPKSVSKELLLERMEPSRTVILACGNSGFMADVKKIAGRINVPFEKEEW